VTGVTGARTALASQGSGFGAPFLSVRDVSFGYQGRHVVADVAGPRGSSRRRFRLEALSFEVSPGEVFGVVGPNSAGKTTLIRLLSGVHAPQQGDVVLNGVRLKDLGRRALARQVAVVPQALTIAFPYTVEELCMMGRHPHAVGLFDGARDLDRVREAMRLAGVEDLARQPVDTLGGGERQRALLARALAQEPRLLLLDEPTAHLDLRHQREMVDLWRRLNRERGTTIVFVSHDLNLASALADRLLLLVEGRVAKLGAPDDVLDQATLEAAYGCPVTVEPSPVSGRPVVLVRWALGGR
jgi:iron complex transport system ATP-binding protein